MITRIALHVLSAENKERAVALLDRNTEALRKAKGFVSRDVYFSTTDPLTNYCVTNLRDKGGLGQLLQAARPPAPSFRGRGE